MDGQLLIMQQKKPAVKTVICRDKPLPLNVALLRKYSMSWTNTVFIKVPKRLFTQAAKEPIKKNTHKWMKEKCYLLSSFRYTVFGDPISKFGIVNWFIDQSICDCNQIGKSTEIGEDSQSFMSISCLMKLMSKRNYRGIDLVCVLFDDYNYRLSGSQLVQ